MTNIPNPFDTNINKTERTGNQKIVEWINQIIKEENLGFGLCEQETSGADRKQPDVILFKAPQSKQITLVLELKPPFFDPLDYEQVKKPAWDKANRRKSPYFATSNFQSLYLFNTEKANKFEQEEKQLVNKYTLSNLYDLNLIEDPRQKSSIYKNLVIFLKDLHDLVYKQKSEKLLAADEWLIFRLQEKVKTLASYYQTLIEQKCLNDIVFRKKLRHWFNDQGWGFVAQTQDFGKAARQTAYLLINKILFYDLLRSSALQNFPQLQIPDDFNKGGMIQQHLQNFFNEVLKIDYETVYSTDFIDEVAFPDDQNVIYHIKELIKSLNRFNFQEVEFEVLGRIFESLIPAEERHILGQYFTHPDIVDIILHFALRKEGDLIFDPGCGAGTFLRRAYHLKKLINPRLSHEEILPTIWGNDIAKFPAHLSTINLAIADLKSDKNYPRIVQKDFFEWLPGSVDLPPTTKKVFLTSLGKDQQQTVIPKYFDAIVGNPPYTRQEEMDDLVGDKGQEYKQRLIAKALTNESGRPYASLSKRAGLHAYFFVHATKFLKNGGRFGFIVSNSWLDVDYGKGLQDHFLNHYKIKAIIESKVERWFEDADINTCIVLLEKCEGQSAEKRKEKENNLVRFVYLKKKLSEFIPKASRIFEETVERKTAVEKLLQYIFSKTSFFENDDLRVYCKNQKEIYDEGFDEKIQKYIGSKWGKYIRAPKIYWEIIEKNKDKLIPLSKLNGCNINTVSWSRKGYNKKIIKNINKGNPSKEKQVIFIAKSPRDFSSIKISNDNLTSFVSLPIKGVNKDEFKKSNILWPDLRFARHICHYSDDSLFFTHAFHGISCQKSDQTYLAAILNSTLIWLFIEVLGRTGLGEGAIRLLPEDFDKEKFIINPNHLDFTISKKIILNFLESKRKVEDIFSECGIDGTSKIQNQEPKPIEDRKALDKLIFSALGLTDIEQRDVYLELCELVKNRLSKAKSVTKKNKTKEGIDISLLVKTIVEKIGGNILGNYYKRNVLSQKQLHEITFPELEESTRIDQTLMGFRLVSGKQSIDFKSEAEARFCQIFLEAGWAKIKTPSNEIILKISPQLEKIVQHVNEAINYYTEGLIDEKMKNHITNLVCQEVSK